MSRLWVAILIACAACSSEDPNAASAAALGAAGAPPKVVFVGNSMTLGAGVTDGADTYPAQTMRALPAGWEATNLGVSGQTTQDELGVAAWQVDPLLDAARQANLLVVWEIGNDLQRTGSHAPDAFARYVEYCQARRAIGWEVVAVTVLPRVPPYPLPPTFAADVVEANNLLREQWWTFAGALADPASRISLQDPTDTYFYVDGIHMTAIGYGVVADTVANAIRRVTGIDP